MQAAERELWKMRAADVAGVDVEAAAACNASHSQSQATTAQRGGRQRRLREDVDMAVPSNSSAGGGDRVSHLKGVGSVEGFEQAGAQGKDEVVVGYWREHSTLTHAIIRNAGHMVGPSHFLSDGTAPCKQASL